MCRAKALNLLDGGLVGVTMIAIVKRNMASKQNPYSVVSLYSFLDRTSTTNDVYHRLPSWSHLDRCALKRINKSLAEIAPTRLTLHDSFLHFRLLRKLL